MPIEAKVICDSVSGLGHRLTTFQLRYPKFIHGEFMTHRVISRNASSSRAVPTAKLIEEVRSDALRAAPVFWGKNQPGMQAAEELDDTFKEWSSPFGSIKVSERGAVKDLWKISALHAADTAERMVKFGAHKQIVNRLLEPFSHINVVATATEWDNFFGLRLHRDAQPEMRALAVAMWKARMTSTPVEVEPGVWHLPFVRDQFDDRSFLPPGNPHGLTPHQQAVRVSVARCARVSYLSFETQRPSTVEEDLRLYDRLVGVQPLHASPAEHQATPDYPNEGGWCWYRPEEHGNFVGWRQYRKMLKGESCASLPAEFAL